jgi:hypothetical protein
MRLTFFSLVILLSVQNTAAQTTDTSKWLRAFPVTDYIVDAGDSVKIVQLQLPDGFSVAEKALGLLYGVYRTSKEDAVDKGYGRCQLIKGDYYYFGISNNKSGKAITGGDLIYTLLAKTNIHYGYIPKLAGHFIEMKDVYDSSFYNRYNVFSNWSKDKEENAIQAMIKDINFTGTYFKENNAAADVLVKSGEYRGQSTFDMMINCSTSLLCDFFDYIIARPRNYAGRDWKVSEVFATWLSEGAPKVVKK